jgi:UDP-N-acetylmuramyl tripeptide synthase
MGAVAGQRADHIVVTSDNPRTESPEAIIDEILAGLPRRQVEALVDRAQAIHHAVRAAGPRDVIVLAGKGHEDYQILPDGRGGTHKRHFDDREVAREALALRAGRMAAH